MVFPWVGAPALNSLTHESYLAVTDDIDIWMYNKTIEPENSSPKHKVVHPCFMVSL